MNERLKELAEQAGFQKYFLGSGYIVRDQELEIFADLVRQDEANGMRETYMKIIHGAIAEEREACAKLCDDMANNQTNQSLLDPRDCAEAIKARGNHEQTR